jgi:hypothetical protein
VRPARGGPGPTLKEFLHELAEDFLHWEGKLATTFRLLVAKPGALTNEYLAGRRIRYISPLRIYLTCSVLFFFVSALVPKPPIVIRTGAAVQTQVGPINISQSDSTQAIAALDTLAKMGAGAELRARRPTPSRSKSRRVRPCPVVVRSPCCSAPAARSRSSRRPFP